MYNSKFISLFVKLSLLERKTFKKSYCNQANGKNKYIILLFNYLFSLKHINKKNTEKEAIYKSIYGNTTYDDLKLRHITAKALVIIEDFLVHNSQENSELEKLEILYGVYKAKRLNLYATQILEKIDNKLLLQKIDLRILYKKAFIEKEKKYHITLNKRIAPENTFLKQFDAFVSYAFTEIFENICEILSNNFTNDNLTPSIIQNYLLFVDNQSFKKNTLLNIYINATKFLIDENKEENFRNFKTLLLEYEDNLSAEEITNCYFIGLNYCIKKNNQNKIEYTRLAIEFYERGIKKGYILENGHLSKYSFSNIISMCIKDNRLEYAVNLLENENHLLLIEEREKTYNFNKIRLLFAKKEYKKCVQTILTTDLQDIIWTLNAKHILLKVLFETNDYDTLEMQLKAFHGFINRKSNIGYHKSYYLSIIKNLTLLNNYFLFGNRAKITIKNDTPDRIWFLEKIPPKLLIVQ